MKREKCPDCGAILSPEVAAGLCPRCMLQRAVLGEPRAGSPEADKLAEQFPDLEILGLLGSGGMGTVYKARQRKLDRLVALKLLHPEVEEDPTFGERFAREARAMARLIHPHIAVVYDYGQTAGTHYLLMEYVEGVTLREVIASGSLSPERSLAIIPQICEALQFAHDAKVVHRDIKPENILISRQGQVKIADFGLAKLTASGRDDLSLTDVRQAVGTPHYMAPEQLENSHAVDHRADIYALGVVIYEMLTGELPLGRFAPPSHKSGVDARLDDVVHKALENQPAKRYQSAVEMKDDVAALWDEDGLPIRRAADAKNFPLAGLRRWTTNGPPIGAQLPLKLAALTIYAFCMVAFFGVGGTPGWIHQAKGGDYYLHTVGLPDRWLEFTGHQGPGLKPSVDVELHLTAGAWFWLPGAALAYYFFWRIRRIENPALPKFRIPWMHIAFWAAFGFASIISGTRFDLHQAMYDLWAFRPVKL